ncbi:MAG: RNase H-like domain-containing protein [Turicibacter sp.]
MYDKVNKSTIISVIDLLSGYGQVGMAEKHKPLTACTDGRGLYEFNVLPFGLTGAPAIFQRTMNYILMDLDHALVYIDDIVVFSTSFEEHLKDLEMVFKRLKLANLKIKPSKCEWAKDSVVYVGHVISKNGIQPNPENVSKVQNFPVPNTVKQVRQFIGLAGYYRRFIQNFAQIAEPLNRLLRFENKFKWGIEQQQAFETLKQKLISEPILRHPDMSKPFLLMTDASNYAIGAVLGQREDGEKDHVIAYASRQLNKHERNYSTIEKEALAIVFAVQTYRHYLIGKKIYLYTDHSPLQWLMTHRNTASRLIRWALSLQEFDIEIRYRKGKANANADALSRIRENNSDINDTVFAIIRQTTNLDEFRKQQQSDDEIKQLFREATIVKKNLEITQLIKNKQKYFIQDGILKCIIGDNVVIVIPKHLRQAIMLQYHDGTLGGHLSARKTMSRIKMKYYWEAMESDIKNWCKTCEVCMTRKNTGTKIKVPLKPMPIPSAPMEITAMDVIGPLPETANGNKYILVFCDYLTKWPEAFALPDQKSETIAQIFVEHIVFRYGTPCKLLTDRGTNFTSDLFKAITELFQILKLTTSPYHPQTDGLVERFNGTLINMLASYTNRQQRDWDLFINSCLYAYRNSVHASTGETPFYLMYLRRNNMPMDLEFQASTTQYMDVPDYKAVMNERMQSAWEKAGLNVRHQQENYKSLYDKNAKPHGIKIGDLVYLNKPEPKKGLSPKLQRPFKGPYKVWGVTETNLQLKPFKNKKADPIIVHANRCKKISEVDEERYPLRSKEKVRSDKPICFTINTKVQSKKSMLSTFLLMICICEVCGHQMSRLTNVSDNEIIKKITIHRRYSMLLWYFNGNARELCLIRNLNITSGNIYRLNINNNKFVIRNLKMHTAYVFRIQYFVAEKDITTQIKTKIVDMQISTSEIKKLIEIEPLETEIHVSWQSLQYLKVTIQFIENNTVIMDTMNHHKSFMQYKN